MIINLYRTTIDEQYLAGKIMWDGTTLVTEGEGDVVKWLLTDVDMSDAAAVEKKLREAPLYFDGGYLRAKVVSSSSGQKYGKFVTIDDRGVFIGGPGSGGGSTASQGNQTGKLPSAKYEGVEASSLAFAQENGALGCTEEEFYANKPEIELGSLSGVESEFIMHMKSAWASSSNGSRMTMAMQQEAANLFGSKLSDWQEKKFAELREQKGELTTQEKTKIRKVLQVMYDETQRKLVEAGFPEYVTLVRGTSVKGNPGSILDIYQNSLSSFTGKKNIAQAYEHRGALIEIRVPRSRILSTFGSGLGTFGECEFVIIGNNHEDGDQVKIIE